MKGQRNVKNENCKIEEGLKKIVNDVQCLQFPLFGTWHFSVKETHGT